MTSPAEQLRVLLDGVEQVLPADEFERKVAAVARGERPPLRVKFGVDPTSPDIHLGHAVVLRKLRDFQRLGHTAVLIIGGFTAQVGDPSDRSTTRPRLTPEQVQANAATYLTQVRKVIDAAPLQIVDNRDWLSGLGMPEVLRLTARMTVAQMLERADFAARYAQRRPIAVSEFLYPLLQGYDSVAVRADVELGGTDQTFNLLVGRDLQADEGQDPQCVVTMPLIEGIDGAAKMSKSLGNAIGVEEPAGEMFGKVMRIPDALMDKYFRLVTDVAADQVAEISAGLSSGKLHPGETKRRLAREIVGLYHSPPAVAGAEARFNVQFRDRGIPDDIGSFKLGERAEWGLADLLVAAGLCASTSEARRLTAQGAVRVDGRVAQDWRGRFSRGQLTGSVLQVGKRRFARLTG
ncbi:MAG: tyrosine--tRNA ligase [Euzebyaceae bacterium]|jgi:tyrosyl-tRNA synthetase|nr:tyrosine--tRNA ligase [Euzebyaceae bacterium]